MRLGTFNVENPFDRAKAMNQETWKEGREALDDFHRLTVLTQKDSYSDKTRSGLMMEKENLSMYHRTVDQTLRIILAVLLTLVGSACTSICDNVRNSFQREFGELVPRPACPPATSCTNPGTDHLTTTAYLPAGVPGERRLLVMHLTSDGNNLQSTYEGRTKYERNQKPIPTGTFNLLTVLMTYDQTVGVNGMTLLEQAQTMINEQHANFATGHGYSSPLVQFVFTNVAVPASKITDPRSLVGVRDALGKWHETKQLNVSDFDFVVVLNPDPSKVEGGSAHWSQASPFFVYVGNYSNWQTNLTASDFGNLARAAYHHELGHHWGWQHDWTPCGNFDPFITNPVLFGWLDTDGDGVPEILDACPYGRDCAPLPPTDLRVQ